MAMLQTSLTLYDVDDVEAFVQACVNRSRRLYPPDERDELVCEGLRIMCELADKFDPHRTGYDKPGRFSGFAARYLPLKLEDAYHRMHPEHVLRIGADGRRGYVYGEGPMSLDHPDSEDLEGRDDTTDVLGWLRRALDERWRERRDVILEVAGVLAEGGSWSDAAHIVGLTAAQTRQAVDEIMAVQDRIRS